MTAAPADLAALMELAEREPATEFAVDLVAGTCRAGQLTVKSPCIWLECGSQTKRHVPFVSVTV